MAKKRRFGVRKYDLRNGYTLAQLYLMYREDIVLYEYGKRKQANN